MKKKIFTILSVIFVLFSLSSTVYAAPKKSGSGLIGGTVSPRFEPCPYYTAKLGKPQMCDYEEMWRISLQPRKVDEFWVPVGVEDYLGNETIIGDNLYYKYAEYDLVHYECKCGLSKEREIRIGYYNDKIRYVPRN
ncbi:hypothetical protein [Oceanirhabdus sp. W0125-5]|uniref:hypothetical protein n=1 Tax=Oceanirhabdus sp. W0125-5 TaxID=2999116 RepID=UPI0022F2DC6F|nr:hypothetical protein [Oceanirhabdus sp. W0125-5]WBW96893.1 hypothetical protein OW730_24865 [Oceanirhabdus sp. W0125-5]